MHRLAFCQAALARQPPSLRHDADRAHRRRACGVRERTHPPARTYPVVRRPDRVRRPAAHRRGLGHHAALVRARSPLAAGFSGRCGASGERCRRCHRARQGGGRHGAGAEPSPRRLARTRRRRRRERARQRRARCRRGRTRGRFAAWGDARGRALRARSRRPPRCRRTGALGDHRRRQPDGLRPGDGLPLLGGRQRHRDCRAQGAGTAFVSRAALSGQRHPSAGADAVPAQSDPGHCGCPRRRRTGVDARQRPSGPLAGHAAQRLAGASGVPAQHGHRGFDVDLADRRWRPLGADRLPPPPASAPFAGMPGDGRVARASVQPGAVAGRSAAARARHPRPAAVDARRRSPGRCRARPGWPRLGLRVDRPHDGSHGRRDADRRSGPKLGARAHGSANRRDPDRTGRNLPPSRDRRRVPGRPAGRPRPAHARRGRAAGAVARRPGPRLGAAAARRGRTPRPLGR